MDTFTEPAPERSSNFFSRAAHLCYNKLLKPNSDNPDLARCGFILNIILLCLGLVFTGLDIVLLIDSFSEGMFDDGIPFSYFSILIFIIILLFLLSRKGYIKLVSYLLIVSSIMGTSYGAYHWGISMPAGLLLFSFIISISSILISSEFGMLLTVLIVCFIIIEGLIESTHHFTPLWRSQPMRPCDGVQYSLILLLTMTLSWLSNREIRHERDSLEIKVQERTKELKRAQIEKADQLHKFAEFGKLSSGIFHDLMNSLSSVVLSVNNLEKKNLTTPSDSKENILKAVALSKRMGNYLQTIKKQMRSEENKASFSVRNEISDCIEMLSYSCRETGTKIKFRESPETSKIESCVMYGNPHKFYQVIFNLVVNAIDACKNKPLEERRVLINLIHKPTEVKIEISDNGEGIRPEIISRLFDPFFTTKKDGSGMGLGLSLVKQIVENDFRGRISFSSKIHKGSQFKVCIPLINGNLSKGRS